MTLQKHHGDDWLEKAVSSPQVQVALDVLKIKDGLRIANAAKMAGINWIEAGTPLIKNEGIQAVRDLRREFPNQVLVADMKTLDAGGLEAEIAFQAGADIMTVSALSNERTLMDALHISRKYDGRVMADLIMTENTVRLTKHLEKLGIDIVCAHTGIDTQVSQNASIQASTIKRLVQNVAIPVAAAGGVNPFRAHQLVRAGISIVIVGGWITRARSPVDAAKRVVASIRKYGLRTVKATSAHKIG